MNLSFDSSLLFSVLFTALFGNNLIFYHTQWTNHLMSRDILKCYDFLVYDITTLLVFDQPKFREFYWKTLQSRNVGAKSVGTKVNFWEKCTLSFLHEVLSI